MTGRTSLVRLLAGAALALSGVACGDNGVASDGPVTVRLGYFPNITHATAIAGVEKGFFVQALGSNAKLATKTFSAGPEAVEAIFAEALDITYIGPNPAINAYTKSKGVAVRIIAGATSGGAALVVKASITSAAGLKGKKIASPQRGNTQDVALRAWLAKQGFKTTLEGGGDVKIVPQANAQTLETFTSGAIQGAWVPEPWATRLVLDGGGKVLVKESALWPNGKFVTTHLMVRTKFLREHPDVVQKFLAGHVEANKFVNGDATAAKAVVNAAIEKLTGKALRAALIDQSWTNLTFTVDPIASSLAKSAADAIETGLLEPVDLKGLYELALLNGVLRDAKEQEVSGL